jgi:hypothetical protein
MMKKKLWFTIMIFSGLGSSVSHAEEPVLFRGLEWGISANEVIIRENLAVDASGYIQGMYLVQYDTNILRKPAVLFYGFAEDRLTRGGYMFIDVPQDGIRIIGFSEKILRTLTDKYGEPRDRQVTWNDERYRGNLLQGFQSGTVSLCFFWNFTKTHISLDVYFENGNPTIRVLYQAPEYVELEEQVKAEAAQEQF